MQYGIKFMIFVVVIAIAVCCVDHNDPGEIEASRNADAVYGNMSDRDRMEGVVLEP